MTRIAIFGSGGGTNAQALLDAFRFHPLVEVGLVASNRPQAFILERASAAEVPKRAVSKAEAADGNALTEIVRHHGCAFIVLAGYLKKIPNALIDAFPGRILNIHPALLPRHGGPGMYGLRVHEAVLAAGDRISGCTVHRVTAQYDEGPILDQAVLTVEAHWTPEQLQAAVLKLEHQLYPRVVERECLNLA